MPKITPWLFVRLENGCECFVSCPPSTESGLCRVIINDMIMDIRAVVYTMRNGKIPDDHIIESICGNKQCCHKDHLSVKKRLWGTRLSDAKRSQISDYIKLGWTANVIAWATGTTATSVKRVATSIGHKVKV